MSVVELVAAGFTLWAGVQGGWHVGLLGVWIVITLVAGMALYRRQKRWTSERLDMTHDLVERMVGHRTRLAQQSPSQWHQGEEESLERYLATTRNMDHGAVKVALTPRSWLVVAFVALLPVLGSTGPSITGLAISIGGIILAYQALQKLSAGIGFLGGAAISWSEVKLFFVAAAQPQGIGSPQYSLPNPDPAIPIVSIEGMSFAYPRRKQPILENTDLEIDEGGAVVVGRTLRRGKIDLCGAVAGTETTG